MSAASDFLPPRMLERLGGLDLIARTIVSGFQTGVHRSPHRGAGEDFAKHRDYQQGDDVRYLDWKLYARTDRLHVREFEERSNLQAYLVVDTSASMDYGEPGGVTKARYAAFLAAALSHLMLRAGDAVGLATWGAEAKLLLPPRSRRGHLHDLLLHLERIKPAGSGAAEGALDLVGGALRRRGRIVIISDLLEDDGGESLVASAGRLRARGDEAIVMRILTPAESGERAPGAGLFFDPEKPGQELAATPEADAGYGRRVAAYYDSIADRLRERGVEYVPLLTSQPVEEALVAWVNRRRGA